MSSRVVINASPLIVLARANALETIGSLPLEFVCPLEVRQELRKGAANGHPGALPPWVKPVPLSFPLHQIGVANLDLGEAAVIQLALEQNIRRVCIDDLKGRRAARAAGLKLIGSLGLLVQAKRHGLTSEVRPYVEQLRDVGAYYNENLIRHLLKKVGEDQ